MTQISLLPICVNGAHSNAHNSNQSICATFASYNVILCVKMSKLLLMFDVDYLYDRLLFQELQEYLKDLEVWEHKLKDKQNNIASTPTITYLD